MEDSHLMKNDGKLTFLVALWWVLQIEQDTMPRLQRAYTVLGAGEADSNRHYGAKETRREELGALGGGDGREQASIQNQVVREVLTEKMIMEHILEGHAYI